MTRVVFLGEQMIGHTSGDVSALYFGLGFSEHLGKPPLIILDTEIWHGQQADEQSIMDFVRRTPFSEDIRETSIRASEHLVQVRYVGMRGLATDCFLHAFLSARAYAMQDAGNTIVVVQTPIPISLLFNARDNCDPASYYLSYALGGRAGSMR